MFQLVISLLTVTLVLLSLGYIVLTFANKEKKGMKTAGLYLGWAVIAVALVSFVASIYFVSFGQNMGYKMMGKKAPMKMMMRK